MMTGVDILDSFSEYKVYFTFYCLITFVLVLNTVSV